jgi:hypothetical protein
LCGAAKIANASTLPPSRMEDLMLMMLKRADGRKSLKLIIAGWRW